MSEIVIGREAAVEALRRCGYDTGEQQISNTINQVDAEWETEHQVARAIQELWDNCPDKRPVDKRVVAMRSAWLKAFESFNVHDLGQPRTDVVANMLVAFDAKLAELGAGDPAIRWQSAFQPNPQVPLEAMAAAYEALHALPGHNDPLSVRLDASRAYGVPMSHIDIAEDGHPIISDWDFDANRSKR